MTNKSEHLLTIYKKLTATLLILNLVACSQGSSSISDDTTVEPGTGDSPLAGAAIDGTTAGNSNSLVQNSGQSVSNEAPEIVSMSLGCDLLLDYISVNKGETAQFTLNVDDESPSTLKHTVTSDDAELVEAFVDDSGVISLSAYDIGETLLSIRTTDEQGENDEIFVGILVEE